MSDYDTITQKINTLVKTPAPAGTMFSNLDQQRDLTVKKLESDYNAQTTVMTVNKQVKDVVGFFKKAFGGTKSELAQNKHTIARLQTSIDDSQSTIDQLGQTGPVIQQLLILVASVAIIYFMGSNLGPLVHFAAFVVLVTGTYYIISGSPNNGESTVSSVFSAISTFSSSIWNSIASSL
jgi:septal ring factor EnvC (AmiA/AmiB activator)